MRGAAATSTSASIAAININFFITLPSPSKVFFNRTSKYSHLNLLSTSSKRRISAARKYEFRLEKKDEIANEVVSGLLLWGPPTIKVAICRGGYFFGNLASGMGASRNLAATRPY